MGPPGRLLSPQLGAARRGLGGGWVRPPPSPSYRRYGDLYLQSYQWLANEADNFGLANGSNRVNYKLRPKMHSVQHMTRSQILNPRRVQTDTDESFMNIIKKIGRSTHGLNSMMRVAQRWLLGIACRFKRKA